MDFDIQIWYQPVVSCSFNWMHWLNVTKGKGKIHREIDLPCFNGKVNILHCCELTTAHHWHQHETHCKILSDSYDQQKTSIGISISFLDHNYLTCVCVCVCMCELTGSRSAAPCSVPVGEAQSVFPGWPEAHPYSPTNCGSQRRAFAAPRGLDYQTHTDRRCEGERVMTGIMWINVST